MKAITDLIRHLWCRMFGHSLRKTMRRSPAGRRLETFSCETCDYAATYDTSPPPRRPRRDDGDGQPRTQAQTRDNRVADPAT